MKKDMVFGLGTCNLVSGIERAGMENVRYFLWIIRDIVGGANCRSGETYIDDVRRCSSVLRSVGCFGKHKLIGTFPFDHTFFFLLPQGCHATQIL